MPLYFHAVRPKTAVTRNKTAGFPLQPVVVQLDPASAAGGFARAWPRPDERLEKHLSYALQWWGFALATVAIWIAVNLRRSPPP